MYIYVNNILFNNNYLINNQFIHQRTLSTFFFLGFEDKQHLVSKLYFT